MPFLTALADWCREVTDDVTEHPGWETRGRSGGSAYAAGRPWCVMYHHTASNDDDLADYHATGSDNAPVCNLDIRPDGSIVVIAAGPTNTNGKGSGTCATSKGVVPADSMNSYALGIEFYNNGVGGPWPAIQVDVGFAVIANLQRHLGLVPTDLFTHAQYAPDRKIDPATADAVQGLWHPRAINSSGTWNDDDLRHENSDRADDDTDQPPEEDEDDMKMLLVRGSSGALYAIAPDMQTAFALWSEDYNALLATGQYVETEGLRDDTIARIPNVVYVRQA